MLSKEGPKFIADDMVGKLAKWLRILGYDVKYFHSIDNEKLISIANTEHRVLLTRDEDLAASEKARQCVLIESDNYREQLSQVIRLLSLEVKEERIFSRCLICNETLTTIKKEDIDGKVPPFVYETRDEFVICRNCNKIFWKGTHNENIREVIDNL